MNIAIVTTIYPPDIGGPATYVKDLSTRLSKKHNVHVITWGYNYKNQNESYKVHVIKSTILPSPFKLIINLYRMSKLTKKVILENNIQIIYAQNSDTAGLPALYAAKQTKIPLVIKFVGDWSWETSILKNRTKKNLDEYYLNPDKAFFVRFTKFFERTIAENADAFVVPSNYLKKILKLWPVDKPIFVIPNAISLNNVKKIQIKHPYIICVGRLVPWKDFDSIIKIIKFLPDINLYIIGEGPSRKKLENLAINIGVKSRVNFLGRQSRDITLSYIKGADFLVLPSIYEGMSHVLLESMYLKTKIIASDNQANRELLQEGELGGLMNFKDQNANIVLKQLIKNYDSTKVNKAYNHVIKNYTWDIHTLKLIELFQSLLHSKK